MRIWRARSDDPYVRLVDASRLATAVEARSRERNHRRRAEELATWIGLLYDLAERDVPVSVRLVSGAVRRGFLVAVGLDHVVLRFTTGGLGLVTLDQVACVRPEPGGEVPAATGLRDASQDRTLLESLEHLLAGPEAVALGLRGSPEPLLGTLVALGEDVVTLRRLGGDGGTTYVPVSAIAEVVLDP
jgi:hypothetical protein